MISTTNSWENKTVNSQSNQQKQDVLSAQLEEQYLEWLEQELLEKELLRHDDRAFYL